MLFRSAMKRWLAGPWFVKGVLQRCSGVLCTTRMEAERLITYGARPPVHVVPLPVQPASPAPAGAREAFRRRHGIPTDAEVVLFLSRIDPIKGIEVLIPALAALKRLHPRLWFVLAGSGEPDFMGRVRGWVQYHGISEWTTLPGFLAGDAKQAAFAASDMFVLPSRKENFGIVVVEAMYAGLPVVISNVVQIHEEIVGEGAGVSFETGEATCRTAIASLLHDAEARRVMGERARRAAGVLFSPATAAARLEDVYLSCRRGVGSTS